jgi:hypothetical protein
VSPADEIFVRLPDEAVDVWRPVLAESLGDHRYRILEQPYDRDAERWEFEPGDDVVCELIGSSQDSILAAVSPS